MVVLGNYGAVMAKKLHTIFIVQDHVKRRDFVIKNMELFLRHYLTYAAIS